MKSAVNYEYCVFKTSYPFLYYNCLYEKWTRILLGHTVLLNHFEDACFYSSIQCYRIEMTGEGSGSGYVLWLQVLYRTTVCPIVTVYDDIGSTKGRIEGIKIIKKKE